MNKIKSLFLIITLFLCHIAFSTEVTALSNGLRVAAEQVNSDRAYITVLIDYSCYDDYLPYSELPAEWKELPFMPSYGMLLPNARQGLLNSFSIGYAKQPKQAFTEIGGSLTFSNTPDYLLIHAETPKDELSEGLQILKGMLERVPGEGYSEQSLNSVPQTLENNSYSKTAISHLYSGVPYGFYYSNDTSSLSLVRGVFISIMQTHMVKPSKTIVSVVSGNEIKQTISDVNSIFSKWINKQNNWMRLGNDSFLPPIRKKIEFIEIDNITVSYYYMTALLPSINTEEYAVGLVLTALFDGVGGELFQNLRVKEQLAYFYNAANISNRDANILQISAEVSSDDFGLTSKIINLSVAKIMNGQITEEELFRAKNYAVTKILNNRRSPDLLSNELAKEVLFFGGDTESNKKLIKKIEAVTTEEVTALAAERLKDTTEYIVMPKLKNVRGVIEEE